LFPSVRALLPLDCWRLRLFRGRPCHFRRLPSWGHTLPFSCWGRWLRWSLLLPSYVLLLLLALNFLLLLPLDLLLLLALNVLLLP
jgi:hypothetical protein